MSASPISEETINKIALLARLKLQPDEVARYSKHLGAILDYASKLSEVDTKDVEPLVTATVMTQTFFDDKVEIFEETELLTGNAPEKSGNLFKVPPVL